MVRSTEDVDLLVEESRPNLEKVLAGLAKLEDGAAAERTPKDFEDNLVIKIADEVEVDVSLRAWTVSYAEAIPAAQSVNVGDVTIPFLSLQDLIKSKSTHRLQDQLDVARLQLIARERDRES